MTDKIQGTSADQKAPVTRREVASASNTQEGGKKVAVGEKARALSNACKRFISCRLAQVRENCRKHPADFWHHCLFSTFWLSLAIFPIGYGAREVLPPLCLVFLLLYYHYDWPNSVLRRLGRYWPFYCAAITILMGILFSRDPWSSFLHAGANFSKACILPFIAMECVRDIGELRKLAWACVFACFWQGLDGVWQAFTGYDFIMRYPLHDGRLTGSLGDYSVGNYLALAFIPALGVWFILKQKLDLAGACFVTFALMWPAFFLFIGASSRSAVLAVAGALCLWAIMRYGMMNYRVIVWPTLTFLLFMLFQGFRFFPGAIFNDNRWDLWGISLKVFWAHPLFGAGAGQYNPAFRELGLAPAREVITISHPHNLFLDILYAHGLIGFCFAMAFIFGYVFWGFERILPHLRGQDNGEIKLYWTLCAWFWLGYVAWLINGIFGHDLYRIWWFALAMCNLGIMIGAVVNGERATNQGR